MSRQRIYEGQIRDQLATGGDHSKRLLQRFSGAFFQSIEQGLLSDGHVRLHRFGSFKLQWTKARRGRHPRTGEPITIPAQPRVVFTPARALREQVNGELADADTAEQPQTTPTSPVPAPAPRKPAPEVASMTQETPVGSAEPAIDRVPPQVIKKSPLLPRAGIAIIGLVTLLAVFWLAGPTQTRSPVDQSRQITTSTESPTTPTGHESVTAEPETRDQAAQAGETMPLAGEVEQTDRREQAADGDTVQSAAINAQDIADNTAEARTGDPTDSPGDAPFFRERPHTLKNGDSLWRLSRRHYINPFYWPHIYQANRDDIHNPNRLLIGRTIQLPRLQGKPGELTELDRRHIAEGYFQVYRYYKKHDRPFPYYALLGAHKFDPSVIERHISEIEEQDWKNLQLASN